MNPNSDFRPSFAQSKAMSLSHNTGGNRAGVDPDQVIQVESLDKTKITYKFETLGKWKKNYDDQKLLYIISGFKHCHTSRSLYFCIEFDEKELCLLNYEYLPNDSTLTVVVEVEAAFFELLNYNDVEVAIAVTDQSKIRRVDVTKVSVENYWKPLHYELHYGELFDQNLRDDAAKICSYISNFEYQYSSKTKRFNIKHKVDPNELTQLQNYVDGKTHLTVRVNRGVQRLLHHHCKDKEFKIILNCKEIRNCEVLRRAGKGIYSFKFYNVKEIGKIMSGFSHTLRLNPGSRNSLGVFTLLKLFGLFGKFKYSYIYNEATFEDKNSIALALRVLQSLELDFSREGFHNKYVQFIPEQKATVSLENRLRGLAKEILDTVTTSDAEEHSDLLNIPIIHQEEERSPIPTKPKYEVYSDLHQYSSIFMGLLEIEDQEQERHRRKSPLHVVSVCGSKTLQETSDVAVVVTKNGSIPKWIVKCVTVKLEISVDDTLQKVLVQVQKVEGTAIYLCFQTSNDPLWGLLQAPGKLAKIYQYGNPSMASIISSMSYFRDRYGSSESEFNRAVLGKYGKRNITESVVTWPSTLNAEQAAALNLANSEEAPYLLIHGPPGTGKTTTLTQILHSWLNLYKKEPPLKILVSAPSNKAVDNLLREFRLELDKLGEKKELKLQAGNIKLHKIVRCGAEPENQALKTHHLDHLGNLYSQQKKIPYDTIAEKNEAQAKVLEQAKIIFTTCVGAQSRLVKHQNFTHVIVDEAAQGTEPEVLIPITKGKLSRFVMAGDSCQLAPTVLSMAAKNTGLGISIFERLLALDQVPSVFLAQQHRGHPAIVEFYNKQFYKSKLTHAVKPEDRQVSRNEDLPAHLRKPISLCFVPTGGMEVSRTEETFSYYNELEALKVKEVYESLRKIEVPASDILILTPYTGQRDRIRSKKFADPSTISTIDGAQGSEAELTIISIVRDGSRKNLGFVSDPKRMNVILSRSKRKLIVVTCKEALEMDPNWNALLEYSCQLNNAY